ncbi:DNA topoisomerase I, bacterial-type [Trema orientale]|uniref:DNA topoisomerase n=1 Tax=Trema orientale TaxID=63057 RepID=A0A2P5G1D4_TREOI|nr:DNA topoisomerase I, bacterial-type [Trema orientale]
MAMIQLQRGLCTATNTTATATATVSASLSIYSTSSALQLRPFMAKLQCRAIHNYPGACLPGSSFGTGEKYRKSSLINFKKVRQNFHTIRSCGDGSQYAFTSHSQLRFGFLNSFGLVYSFSNGSFSKSLPTYGTFTKRFFSQVTSVKNKHGNMGVQDGKSGGSAFVLQGVNKHRKRAMALAAKRKNGATSSSSSKGIGLEASSEVLVGGGKKDVNLGSVVSRSPVGNSNETSKVGGKKKSRTKKSIEKNFDTLLESDAAEGASGTSRAKKPGTCKTGYDQASKLNVSGSRPAETVESSSTELLSVKKSGNSSKKGKPVKAANSLQLKQKAQQVGQIKPQGQMNLKPLYPPSGKSVVVVESVTKAKVIQGYLGSMFEVLPSYGHVRDLAARSGSVRPDDEFSMVWEVPSAAWTHLKSIKVALNGAENLILASDPDREGEAIAWHIIEMLQQQDALREDIAVARVVFHEITESSIKKALLSPREIDVNLVHAYLARRALDYLIGFNISPLLWRKLPGCQSAGRVQSAALGLICDREMEIDQFKPQEYWTIEIELKKKELNLVENAVSFPAHLTNYDSEKLNQLSISSHTEAKDIENKIKSANFKVVSSKINKTRRNPPTPYITSTLQQDAANKLQFSSTYTMKVAQKLYEGVQLSDGKAAGLITYTRTDGLHISDEAVKKIRSLINERYGQGFASVGAQKYFKKVKNAQEAHEAIRPTDISRLPSTLRGTLDEDSLKLYTLIWCRTVACQMEPASIKQVQLDIGNTDKSLVFRSACSAVEFLGYQAVFKDVEAVAVRYKENEGNDREQLFGTLNSLKSGDPLYLCEVELKQHHTQPPPRYSEASLVKKMEELGIGRPSTYASTMKVLQDRNYVTVKSRVLHPEFRGRMVSAFLSHHFSEVTDYSFTADMETELDNVSAGLTEWKGLLKDYWTRFSSYCESTTNVHIHQV